MRIRPFRAWRYDPARVPDLSRVVVPPYDQVDAEMAGMLLALDPLNFVRVALGRPEPGDRGEADRHRRCRETLDRWDADGVLVRDAEPALYLYATVYRARGGPLTRVGLVAMGELSEYAEGMVLPHERTHAGPKAERLAHLEATGADTGLLFMLAEDEDGALREALTEPAAPPVAEARDLQGEVHRLWRLAAPAAVEELRALLASRRLIIADGHHRYETALEFRRRHPGADWKLMAIFPLGAPGLTILPTHRLLHDVPGFDPASFAGRAGEWFEVGRGPAGLDAAAEADALMALIEARARAGRVAVALAAGGEGPAWLLTLRPEAAGRVPWPAGRSAAWRRLAVSVLHEALLRPLAGIGDEMAPGPARVEYTAEAAEAVGLARKGACQAAFLIAPTGPAELLAVVRAGEVLPQKSTYFSPKLLDGLLFVRLDEVMGGGR